MKKLISTLLLMVMLPCAALGQNAVDISTESKYEISGAVSKLARLTDKSEDSSFQVQEKKEHFLYVTSGETPVAAVELAFAGSHQGIEVQVKQDDAWVTVASNTYEQMSRVYLQLPEPVTGKFRIRFAYESGKKSKLYIREVYLWSEGKQPADKQIWQAPLEKADMMVIVAHPDDELLWFGGTIPYYTAERNKGVEVCYLTCENNTRRSELLAGLWLCGVRNFPDIGTFPDDFAMGTKKIYESWGENKLLKYVVRLIRKYQPEVIVTHDRNGEYGHGAHKACSEIVERAAVKAADPSYDKDSVSMYGTWDTKKVYLHLGSAPTLQMDWDIPMAAFGGMTGIEVAKAAFEMHASQTKKSRYFVAEKGSQYDSTLYTLIKTTVGEDVIGGDFFENID